MNKLDNLQGGIKIDIYPHIMPIRYKEALYEKALHPFYLEEVDNATPTLFDLTNRFRIMGKYEWLTQVLTLASPPVEQVVGPKDAMELSKLANDELAELVTKYPDKFIAAAACLPMNDIDAALDEVDRAIKELNFRGVQIYTPINGKPLDSPEFMPLYEKMSEYDLPIWIHPARGRNTPDYVTEAHSRYWIFSIFGWPYETTAAMTRLVFSGILEKYPNLKFITHHCGGMVPYFEQRIVEAYDYAEVCLQAKYKRALTGPPIEYFRKFYADTAIYGNTPGLMCAYSFFGAEHLLFGTDMPYDSEGGDRYIRQTISSIERMNIPKEEKTMIFEGNAKRLLHL